MLCKFSVERSDIRLTILFLSIRIQSGKEKPLKALPGKVLNRGAQVSAFPWEGQRSPRLCPGRFVGGHTAVALIQKSCPGHHGHMHVSHPRCCCRCRGHRQPSLQQQEQPRLAATAVPPRRSHKCLSPMNPGVGIRRMETRAFCPLRTVSGVLLQGVGKEVAERASFPFVLYTLWM